MRVLVGCETSGKVRQAFRKRGHDAWSCDLLPADAMAAQWEMLILKENSNEDDKPPATDDPE